MICRPCRQGGEQVLAVKALTLSDVLTFMALEAAAQRHAECTSPNCTCQHEVTLDALNEKGFK